MIMIKGSYNSFPEDVQQAVCKGHQEAFLKVGVKKSIEKFHDIFKVVNPVVVIGRGFCRIEKDSVKVVKVAFRSYL